jgi:hypothetical protein
MASAALSPAPVASSAHRRNRRWVPLAVAALYACTTLQFIRFYVVSANFYLNLPAYLAGKERLPFQYRVLPALLIRALYAGHVLHATGMHTKGAFTAERAPLYLISLVSFSVAALLTQAIYATVSRTRALSYVVFPVFLYTMMWTYSIHVEANFSYPYDMLSVAFFAAGLFCIVQRRYWPLLAVIAVGTLNRETTLFLIGIYLLDAAGDHEPASFHAPGTRFNWRRISWWRTALLLAVWLGIKALLAHHYAANDRSEDYVRLRDNLGELKPRLWPALLNICGYMLPVVALFRRDIFPVRFRSYLWIFPVWFAVMFYAGVIVETRIYGELCPYVAVALALIMENRLPQLTAEPSFRS